MCVFDLKTADLGDNDVLVIGSDGLWDLMKIEEVYKSLNNVLQLYNINNQKRWAYKRHKVNVGWLCVVKHLT